MHRVHCPDFNIRATPMILFSTAASCTTLLLQTFPVTCYRVTRPLKVFYGIWHHEVSVFFNS